MLLFGHRGYSDQYSENTMLAFSKAIESDNVVDFMDDHWSDEIQTYKEGEK